MSNLLRHSKFSNKEIMPTGIIGNFMCVYYVGKINLIKEERIVLLSSMIMNKDNLSGIIPDYQASKPLSRELLFEKLKNLVSPK